VRPGSSEVQDSNQHQGNDQNQGPLKVSGERYRFQIHNHILTRIFIYLELHIQIIAKYFGLQVNYEVGSTLCKIVTNICKVYM
jgi:hypothetical protein